MWSTLAENPNSQLLRSTLAANPKSQLLRPTLVSNASGQPYSPTLAALEFLKSEKVGLNRTGHMSVQPGQDRTPKIAGRVLPDRTKSGHIFFPSTYQVWVINLIKKW